MHIYVCTSMPWLSPLQKLVCYRRVQHFIITFISNVSKYFHRIASHNVFCHSNVRIEVSDVCWNLSVKNGFVSFFLLIFHFIICQWCTTYSLHFVLFTERIEKKTTLKLMEKKTTKHASYWNISKFVNFSDSAKKSNEGYYFEC